MRTKEELMREYEISDDPDTTNFDFNAYMFLEVLIDIRDQLAEANYYLKSKIIKGGESQKQ